MNFVGLRFRDRSWDFDVQICVFFGWQLLSTGVFEDLGEQEGGG